VGPPLAVAGSTVAAMETESTLSMAGRVFIVKA
jgi:hypothetical protein